MEDEDIKRLIRQKPGGKSGKLRHYTLRLLIQKDPLQKPQRIECSLGTHCMEEAIFAARAILRFLNKTGLQVTHRHIAEEDRVRRQPFLPLFRRVFHK